MLEMTTLSLRMRISTKSRLLYQLNFVLRSLSVLDCNQPGISLFSRNCEGEV